MTQSIKPTVIGIAGPSAAGKSTLVDVIEREYRDVTHIRLDDFYRDQSEHPRVKQWRNHELPDNIYFDEFVRVLTDLTQGNTVTVPTYSRKVGRRIGSRTVTPAHIIIVEGFLLYRDPRVRELLDVKFFIDTSVENQLARRLERQPDLDVDYFYQVIVPSWETFGQPTATYADHVLDGNQDLKTLEREFHSIIHEYLNGVQHTHADGERKGV